MSRPPFRPQDPSSFKSSSSSASSSALSSLPLLSSYSSISPNLPSEANWSFTCNASSSAIASELGFGANFLLVDDCLPQIDSLVNTVKSLEKFFFSFYIGFNRNPPITDKDGWSLEILEGGSQLYTVFFSGWLVCWLVS